MIILKFMSEIQNELTIEERYKQVEQHEHILKIPDTYMGSIKTNITKIYTFNENSNIITFEKKEINDGLYKIFDEILVNASDNSIKSKSCDTIKVNINDDGSIEVWNNGDTIPIAMHKKVGVYVPHMIFGLLLTSGNYDQVDKTTGGKNGYGAKLTNIYSTYFEIEIVNVEYKKKYVQIFKNNMYDVEEPIITNSKETQSYTKIKFIPDYKRFNMPTLTHDMRGLFKRRTFDLAGTTTKKIMNIYYNNELIKVKNFEDYMNLYYEKMPNYVYQIFNERWHIGVVYDTTKDHGSVSFVNRIATTEGGTHVQYIKDQLIDNIRDKLKKKYKNLTIKPSTIADNLTLFINTTIEDPDFGSQSKEKLKTKSIDFKVPCILDDKFIKKICSMGVLDSITDMIDAKNENEVKKKMDSSKGDNLRGIIKLDDAEWAGTNKSHLCSLILTEGDSAKALAMSGRLDKKIYGIFPLKGKPLNVREATRKQLLENEEIINIAKILGLTQNSKTFKKKRYNNIIIMADADVDGIHIGGLLINLFHFFWKDLIEADFITRFITPVVRATKKNQHTDFFSMYEYEKWTKTINPNSYNIKYYKGLGSWDRLQAVDLFKNFEQKLITYNHGEITDEHKKITDEIIMLAFSKDYADHRKGWVKCYDPSLSALVVNNKITIQEYVNKELIQFSAADNIRSIPDFCDGLKPSQRKVLFGVIDRNLKTGIKVSQIAGYISERTEYHHGEASLLQTIVGMAQNFWCSNNINLLQPMGQFGTRVAGGKDSASARYIFTQLNPLTKYIFKSEDDPILKYVIEDNIKVEPEKYYPVIPMCLVNNLSGIGTGYSTDIPSYNPKDIINNVRCILLNKKHSEMTPWTKFFIGDILTNTPKKGSKKISEFMSHGKYRILDENTLEIYELPLGTWTNDYKTMLELKINPKEEKNKSEYIYDFTDSNTDSSISFKIKFYNGQLQQLIKDNENKSDGEDDVFEKEFKLQTSISTNNMHLFYNNVITKFSNPVEIITTYIPIRLEKYEERRLYMIKILEEEMLILRYTKQYIEDVLSENIKIHRQKKEVIHARLEELKYPKIITTSQNPSYEYLTKLLIFHLTEEEIQSINKKFKDKEEELYYYMNTTNKQLWLKELDELEVEYDIWYEEQLINFGCESLTVPKEKKASKPKKNKKV